MNFIEKFDQVKVVKAWILALARCSAGAELEL